MPQDFFENVGSSLKVLRKEIAAVSELNDIKRDIDDVIENINSPLLVMVMGEFSRGKSTFINALLGQQITKVDVQPTTAVITKLSYGKKDKITVFMRDGSVKNYDTDSFARLTTQGSDKSSQLHKEIDYVERTLPIDILKSMSIIDSPGLNSINDVHEEATKRFMDKADTVIWLFDANDPCKQTEIDALKRLNPRLAPLILVNKIDVIDEDEGDSTEKVLAKIERDLTNNKLEYQKIIGISAQMAFKGEINNNKKLIAASNVNEFYDAINTIILPNREKFKRISMVDELARVFFVVGRLLNDKREENNKRNKDDYSKYIETEESLAGALDKLETVAGIVISGIDSAQSTRGKRLNPAEKSFYGVLHWLGLGVEKDNEKAQQYLEEAAVCNDTIAKNILMDVYAYLKISDRMLYRREKLQSMLYTIGEAGSTVDGGYKNVDELRRLGKKYEDGDGMPKNYKKAMELYLRAADCGDVAAMHCIGELYARGKGVTQDYDKAMEWYRKAATGGNTGAMHSIGCLYSLAGISDAEYYAKAMEWYLKAADGGENDAMWHIGEMYEGGKGVAQDYAKAMEWYLKSVDGRDIDDIDANTMCHIGEMYEGGKGVAQDYSKAMEWYLKAAKAGNYDAMCCVGNFYVEGRSVSKDYSKAMEWYLKAAKAGIYDAMCCVGNFYVEGRSVSKNYSKAMEWYLKAADGGDTDAMWHIGELYEGGKGVAQDYSKAMEWYLKSVGGRDTDGIDANTMWHIGEMYEGGKGIAQDYSKAMEWYLKAAKAGNYDAMCCVGNFYVEGRSVSKNYSKAMEWYLKAADGGDTKAMWYIGELYEGGKGVAQDYSKAMEWYLKSVDGRDTDDIDSDSMWHIGELYEGGKGVAQDYSKAMGWYLKSVDGKDTDDIDSNSMWHIGEMYKGGKGVTQDYAKAMKWYRKAADCGNTDAMHSIGLLYNYREDGLKDFDKAMEWYLKAADGGNTDAMHSIGTFYYISGVGCWLAENSCQSASECYSEAIKWYRKAARGGNTRAMWKIGEMYEDGNGVTKDYSKAMEWHLKAVDGGDTDAMWHIGKLYRDGEVVTQDYAKAIEWFLKSVDCRNTDEIGGYEFWCIANTYKDGKDYSKAMEWFLKAVDCGDTDAMWAIGKMYADGEGVTKDYAKAIEWFLKSVDCRNTDEIFRYELWRIANTYEDGKDYAKAMEWYLKAADGGDPDAMRAIGRLYFEGKGVRKDYSMALRWFCKSRSESARTWLAEKSCFITTAVCDSFNKPDDCYELTMFRNFRDAWLIKQPDGEPLIREYYQVAPVIVEKINNRTDAKMIYMEIWDKYLLPCLRYIEDGDNMRCKELYISMVNTLKKKLKIK